MANKLDTIREEIEAKVKERGEKRQVYVKKLENARASLATAKAKKVAMVSAENVKGVRAAIDEEKDALAECEIYQTKLEALPERSVIDYPEAERLLDSIRKAHGEDEAAIIKKARTHVAALQKLADEYTAGANRADEMAQWICFSLCDTDDYYLMAKGRRVAKKSVSVTGARSFAAFVNKVLDQYLCKELFGIEPNKTGEVQWDKYSQLHQAAENAEKEAEK